MAQTFEEAFAELQSIVDRLRSGELPLEESITLFEQGMRLSFECQKFLDEADRRIEVLVQRADGRLETRPYEGVGGDVEDEGQ